MYFIVSPDNTNDYVILDNVILEILVNITRDSRPSKIILNPKTNLNNYKPKKDNINFIKSMENYLEAKNVKVFLKFSNTCEEILGNQDAYSWNDVKKGVNNSKSS